MPRTGDNFRLRTNIPRRYLSQIPHQQVGTMRLEVLPFRAAGRHGQHPGIDGPGAFDIAGRVADHENLAASQMIVQQPAPALSGEGGKLIAVFRVVGESAGLEQLPQFVVAQFDFRAEPDVAGQQAERRGLGQAA